MLFIATGINALLQFGPKTDIINYLIIDCNQHVIYLFYVYHSQKRIEVKQRPLKRVCIDNTDVFILDLGLMIYQVSYFQDKFRNEIISLSL